MRARLGAEGARSQQTRGATLACRPFERWKSRFNNAENAQKSHVTKDQASSYSLSRFEEFYDGCGGVLDDLVFAGRGAVVAGEVRSEVGS